MSARLWWSAAASRAPVLVGRYETVGRHALIGWSATREAARAVSDAMPLLAAAEIVTVLTIDAREGTDAHGELPGADISLHLARDGGVTRSILQSRTLPVLMSH